MEGKMETSQFYPSHSEITALPGPEHTPRPTSVSWAWSSDHDQSLSRCTVMTIICLRMLQRFSASFPFRGRKEHINVWENLFIKAVKPSWRTSNIKRQKRALFFSRCLQFCPTVDSFFFFFMQTIVFYKSFILFPFAFQETVLFWTRKYVTGTSLAVQWLRIHLLMQGTRVRALVWEDTTWHGATKPVRHNYWACALEPASHN